MSRYILLFCSLLLILNLQPACEANPLVLATSTFKVVMKIYKGFQGVKGIFGLGSKDIKTEIIENQEKNSKLFLEKLDQLSEDLDHAKTQILDYFLENVEKQVDIKISKLSSYVKEIEQDYQVFVNYLRNATILRKKDLNEFADDTLKVKGLSRTVLNMHDAFVERHERTGESMISFLMKKKTAVDTVCYKGLSAQQFVWYLYDVITKADSKAMLTKLFALDIAERRGWKKIQDDPEKQRKKHIKFEKLRIQEQEQYFERMKKTLELIKEELATAPRELWRCDPKNHQNGTTYVKIGEVFQGYFIEAKDIELNFKPGNSIFEKFTHQHMAETARRKTECSVYKHRKIIYKSHTSKIISFNKRCQGEVWHCKAAGGNQLDVCFAPDFHERQYYWARVQNTDTYYGQRKPCNNTLTIGDAHSSKMCYCTCETVTSSKIRYFSLNSETSDIHENKVVTGIRFKESNNVFYIQIQQGQLAENGSIIGNLSWKQEQTIKSSQEQYQVKYKQKTVFLDEFNESGDKVVTGLRFQKVDSNLRLEIRFTQFDYSTGKLDLNAPEVWQHNSNAINERTKIDIDGRHDPSTSTKQSEIIFSNNHYINFDITNLESDVGQNTIPYLDVQPVEMVTPSPISGAGIYHKSDGKSGGFLGLKMFNYDYSQHIE